MTVHNVQYSTKEMLAGLYQVHLNKHRHILHYFIEVLLYMCDNRPTDEDSLSEIALSDASKLVSTYFSLFYRSVHVLYTGICILGGCLC